MPLPFLDRHRVVLLGFCRFGEVQDSFGKCSLRRRAEREYYSYHSLVTYSKQRSTEKHISSMDWSKKRKGVNPAWRPVTTVSCLNADMMPMHLGSPSECSADIPITESSNLVNKYTDSVRAVAESNFRSTNLQDKFAVSEAEGVMFDSARSSVLPDCDEFKTAEEASDLSTAKHSVSIEVGASLMPFIKGKGGATQKDIEEEMGVKIIFPSDRKADFIVIQGDSANITKAVDKIKTIINEAVQSPNLDYSHFISLPLAIHPELVEKLFRFQNSILGNYSEEEIEVNADDDSDNASEDETKSQTSENAPAVQVTLNVKDLGIDKSIFIKPKTFHLTVLMLKLWNKERLHAAKEVLERISTEVMGALDGRPLSIRLKGLDFMRGSLANARVLYAPVEEIGNDDRLMRACQIIIDAYSKAGLVLEKDARQKLKLHATLMNARHGKRKIKGKRKDSFDARAIFERYGSEEWGEYHIREAHLSQRFVFDDSGYYHCCASIPFPTTRGLE